MAVSERSIAFGKQSAFETAVALCAVVRDFISESFKHTRNMILEHTAGFLEPRTQAVGSYKVSGTIETLCVPDEIGEFLSSLFGAPGTVSHGTYFTHTFIPKSDKRFYTIRINKDNVARKYTGAFVKRWKLKIAPGKPAYCSWDMVAKKDEVGTYATGTFETYMDSLNFLQVAVTIGGPAREVRALELDTGYAADEDYTMLGDQTLQDQVKKEHDTTLSLDLKFDTDSDLIRFYNGTLVAGAGGPENTVADFAIVITITGNAITGGNKYSLTITLPKCVGDVENSNVDKRNLVLRNVVFKPRYDATYGIQVVLQNRFGSYA